MALFASARHGGMQGGWDGGAITAVPQMLTVGAPPLEDDPLTRTQVQEETYNFIRHFQQPPFHIYRCELTARGPLPAAAAPLAPLPSPPPQ